MEYTEILTFLRRIIRTVNLESKRIEKEYGVSIPQLLTLNFLSRREGYQASHKDVKDFLSLNASTVTGIIARLERKGLVAKLPKREDRRVSFITLTARGANLIEKTPVLFHERLSQRLRSLGADQLTEIKRAFALIGDLLEVDETDEEISPIVFAGPSLPPEE